MPPQTREVHGKGRRDACNSNIWTDGAHNF